MRTIAPAPDTVVDGPDDDATLRHNYRRGIPTTFHTLRRGKVTIIMTSLEEDTTLGPDWAITGISIATGVPISFWYNSRCTIGIEV